MGSIHPISSLIREANQIFLQMGFTFAEGHLVESEYYNFDALNVPKDHPARDMQDTFYIKDTPEYVLRTHTSPVQVRYMEKQIKKGVQPPYRVIVPGKAFRNEATDMTHEVEFTQIEGLVVGEDISLANLKGTLEIFFRSLFKGAQVEIRFRPSFFPFVEPGVEVDMRLVGDGVPEKLKDKWMEMMGAGMVLRTHTSNVQGRYMEEQMKKGTKPPYRAVSMGKAFRNESTDMGHEAEFSQIEILVVDKNVSVANLKWTLETFFEKIFNGSVDVRFRPTFFPFVEPGLEIDMRLSGERVPEKLRGKWMEMGGAGMVHPNVLRNCGINTSEYQG
ncbi:MAG TPA: hypothetical protein VJZ94_02265, partial [Candidatus Paceibacterota bacterium]|nr:hypothetical protein [Candidatus Paceibacterota bacterium]